MTNKVRGLLLVPALAFAVNCTNIKAKKMRASKQSALVAGVSASGAFSASNLTIDELDASGFAKLRSVVINNGCKASGRAQLYDTKISGNCTLSGSAELQHVVVDNTLKMSGSCSASDVKAKELICSGSAKLVDVVAEHIKAAGSLKVVKAKANHVESAGSCKADDLDCKILALKPDSSSTTLSISKSTVGQVTVTPGSWSSNNFKIEILGFHFSYGDKSNADLTGQAKTVIVNLDGTTVEGDITFTDMTGTVRLTNGARVLGQVIGGELVNN